MSWQGALIAAGFVLAIGADLVARMRDRKWQKLQNQPRPTPDERDWHNIFMKDVK